MKYLLSGVGGIGLSALAWQLKRQGHEVFGSDRSYDQGLFPDKYQAIEAMGVKLVAQDGVLIDAGQIDVVVASSAVEDRIADIAAAKRAGVKIQNRAQLLAQLLNQSDKSVAVAGTSGKSTVTALTGFLAMKLGLDPTIINGAKMPDFSAVNDPSCSVFGNARIGESDVFIAEACESDGSVILYQPYIALVNNITLDHKPVAELRPLFQKLIDQAKGYVVVNYDDPEVMALDYKAANVIGYSTAGREGAAYQACDVRLNAQGAEFRLLAGTHEYQVKSPLMGLHNVQNTLAALAMVVCLGGDLQEAVAALPYFHGIKARMELVGSANGITVIDDYAHNPDKISAALATVKAHAGRVIAYYQPHGFAPTKLMKDGYIDAFSRGLGADDKLYLQEIYYAGGTVDKDISSEDIAASIRQNSLVGVKVSADRDELLSQIIAEADDGDVVLIMGARDDSIREIAPEIAKNLA